MRYGACRCVKKRLERERERERERRERSVALTYRKAPACRWPSCIPRPLPDYSALQPGNNFSFHTLCHLSYDTIYCIHRRSLLRREEGVSPLAA